MWNGRNYIQIIYCIEFVTSTYFRLGRCIKTSEISPFSQRTQLSEQKKNLINCYIIYDTFQSNRLDRCAAVNAVKPSQVMDPGWPEKNWIPEQKVGRTIHRSGRMK